MTTFEKFEKIIINNGFVKSVDGEAKRFLEDAPVTMVSILHTDDAYFSYTYEYTYEIKDNVIKIAVCLHMEDEVDVLREMHFLKVERYGSIYEHIDEDAIRTYAKKFIGEFINSLNKACNNVIVGG